MSGPVRLLIGALGGEGGGVLTDWIVAAAHAQGFAVQATSVPGVAQRTGATTYYVEIGERDPAGRAPVFALFPVAGEVDVMVSSELAETARAAERGFITPERTTLISSTDRVLLMREKSAMADGRLDADHLRRVAEARARRVHFLDMAAISRETGAPVSAVMLGALAGADVLAIGPERFKEAVRAGGKALAQNLRAFEMAFDAVRGRKSDEPAAPTVNGEDPSFSAFPAAARDFVRVGHDRLVDYQDEAYARLYLDRLARFAGGDARLCREVARHLALRMSYEDVIRVAQLKARPDRFERIRGELRLDDGSLFDVEEFFKPGVREAADILPPVFARPLLAWAARSARVRNAHLPMKVRTSTINGYLRVWGLAKLRRFRRGTWRYRVEQAGIERWLDLIARAAAHDTALAVEIAGLARLIKGYGDTHARGTANFERIVDSLVVPALAAPGSAPCLAATLARAREAALADPDGTGLESVLASDA